MLRSAESTNRPKEILNITRAVLVQVQNTGTVGPKPTAVCVAA
jgi:hypothetical protein